MPVRPIPPALLILAAAAVKEEEERPTERVRGRIGTLGRAICSVGFWIREMGQALDRLGSRLQGNYYFQEQRDVNNISIRSGTNIQDNSLAHVAISNLAGKVLPTIIGDNVTVDHSAVLYGCTIEYEAFVGMGLWMQLCWMELFSRSMPWLLLEPSYNRTLGFLAGRFLLKFHVVTSRGMQFFEGWNSLEDASISFSRLFFLSSDLDVAQINSQRSIRLANLII
ncbi:hypothetical protein Ancab_026507 [Ancistrocladus abbreviatus]